MVRKKVKRGFECILLSVKSRAVGRITRPPRYGSDLGSE